MNGDSAYDERISELASDEGHSLDSESRDAPLRFIGHNNPHMRHGRLVLLENGNLRTVWKRDDGSHIGLQFLNNGLFCTFRSSGDRPASQIQEHADETLPVAYFAKNRH